MLGNATHIWLQSHMPSKSFKGCHQLSASFELEEWMLSTVLEVFLQLIREALGHGTVTMYSEEYTHTHTCTQICPS